MILKGKAAGVTGRATAELKIYGWEIEAGFNGDAASIGGEVTFGFHHGQFHNRVNASSGLGGGYLFRVKPNQGVFQDVFNLISN